MTGMFTHQPVDRLRRKMYTTPLRSRVSAGTPGFIGAVTTATDSLRLRVRIDADPDTVFKALTDGDELSEWLAESAEVALDQARYEFWGRYAPQGDRPRQSLTAHEPGRLLRYTWSFDEGPSTVELSLVPDGDGTVATVSHTGIPGAGSADGVALRCFWHVSMANLVAYSEGTQTMPPFDFSVPAQGDALVRTVIDVPVEEVFASLLDTAKLDKWVGGTSTVDPHVGGRYDFGWDNRGPERITELEPDKVLAYSWRLPGITDTVVRWALRSSRGSTYVTLVHSGFTDDTVAEEFRQGWPAYLVELKRLLELGPRWEPIAG
jgi:uncharacterized protein YndB with AHSA1/START domain